MPAERPTPRSLSPICSRKSGRWVTPAAPTCWVRYLNQSRAEGDRPVTTSRHASRLLLTNPENLRPKDTTLLEKIAAACSEMTALADLVHGFAALLKPAAGNDVKLTEWICAHRPHRAGGNCGG